MSTEIVRELVNGEWVTTVGTGGGGGGSQNLEQVLTEGADGGGLVITNLGGLVLNGFNDVDLGGANAINAGTWNGDVDTDGGRVKTGGGNVETEGGSLDMGEAGIDNCYSIGIIAGGSGILYDDPQEVPAVGVVTLQDVVSALVARGIITQALP